MNTNALKGEIVVVTGKLSVFSRREIFELIEKCGGEWSDSLTASTTTLVLGEKGYAREIVKSQKLKRAEALVADGAEIDILPESEFLHKVDVESGAELDKKFYSISRICQTFPTLSPGDVKYFEKRNLVQPLLETHTESYFAFADLNRFREIHDMLRRGLTRRNIAQALLGDKRNDCQLELSFSQPVGAVVSFPIRKSAPSEPDAIEWYNIGYENDGAGGSIEKAIHAYQKALSLQPDFVEATINLARIYHSQNQPVAAKQYLLRALEKHPDQHLVRYNLGVAHEALSEIKEAVKNYEAALLLAPDHTPTLFNLAQVSEKSGEFEKANRLWGRYLKIDSESEWAEIAKKKIRGSVLPLFGNAG